MSAAETAVRYVVNASMSRFSVRAFATGLFSSLGHSPTLAIRNYTGEVTLPSGGLEQALARLSVEAGSLEVTDDVSGKDRAEIESRMKQEVLETSSYPEIVFESSQVSVNPLGGDRYAVNVTGNLALHGVTKSETISAQVSLTGDTLRAYGDFSLRQTDYGIKLVSVAGGALKVRDELKFSFYVLARKQE